MCMSKASSGIGEAYKIGRGLSYTNIWFSRVLLEFESMTNYF